MNDFNHIRTYKDKEEIGVMEAQRQLEDTVLIVVDGGSSPSSLPTDYFWIWLEA